jgi:anti-sigma factor RsiW
MTCEETHILLDALIDNELDAGHAREVEAHVASCPCCTAQLRDYRGMHDGMSGQGMRYQVPERLRSRIETALPKTSLPAARAGASSRRSLFRGFAMGSVVSTALAACLVLFVVHTEDDQRIVGDVVSAHLRSLQGDHLIDVVSTDQHTVKPWFNGRLDVAPPSSTSRRRVSRSSAAVSTTSTAGRWRRSCISGAPMSSICSFRRPRVRGAERRWKNCRVSRCGVGPGRTSVSGRSAT